MAHKQQAEFVGIIKKHFPDFFSGARVIEIGSLDINGSVRSHFAAAQYVGVDLEAGPGVDLVSMGHEVSLPADSFDCAVSLECFEHNPYWAQTFANMMRLTRPGGLVLMTCATTGRREHGTARTTPDASPFTINRGWSYYRNLTESDFQREMDFGAWLSDWRFYIAHESYDLYFVGRRHGGGKIPEALDRDVRARFNPWHSLRAFRRYVKTALLGKERGTVNAGQ